MSDNNTDKPLADAVNVAAADGGAAVPEEVSTIHEVLGKALGKEFKDSASAIKAVQDTFSYVGKVGKFAPKLEALQQALGGESKLLEFMDNSLNNQGTPAPAVDTSQFVTKEDLARDSFYRDNPQFKPYQSVIDGLTKSEGKTPSEIVASDSFKPFFEKVQAADATASQQSVLHSNPRLGAVTDKFAQAGDAAKAGNFAAGAALVTDAVIESFPGLKPKE